MPLEIVRGDLFDSNCQTLTNAVNCSGVMGKGIAKQFKKFSKIAFEDYRLRCEHGEVVPGKVHVFGLAGGRQILHFPTKRHWRSKARIEHIRRGLEDIRDRFRSLGIESLALPAVGCGEGGLDWDSQVKPLMEEILGGLPIRIEVYLVPESGSRATAQLPLYE